MEKEIINRIEKSPLITLDLEDFYPKGERLSFDISEWLYEGFLLKEKDFREKVTHHDWNQYKDKFVALNCSTDAIIPSWAFLLLTIHLQDYTKYIVQGNLQDLEEVLFHNIIWSMDLKPFQDKSIIIKGCGSLPIPENAYILLIQRIKPIAKSISFGEACSTVPLYKRKKI